MRHILLIVLAVAGLAGAARAQAPARAWALSINGAGGLSLRQDGREIAAVRDGAGPALEVSGGARFAGDAAVGGSLEIAGALVRGCDTIRIDHPLDPENTYLCHAPLESPERATVHGGNVVLDGKGEARVTLPDWFEALNGDVRYQLTAVGAPAPDLHVAAEVAGNRFRIAGGRPGLKVSWQVTGVRRDPCAESHPLRVEVPKPEAARGRLPAQVLTVGSGGGPGTDP